MQIKTDNEKILVKHLERREKKETPLKDIIEEWVRKNKSKSPLLVATPRMEQRNKS